MPISNAVLVPVLVNHRFDETALQAYLAPLLPGAEDGLVIQQFQGGQSNPTFHVQAGSHGYVLRKKPPGQLLPSAHAIDREFRVQRALAGSNVPIANMRLYCEDAAIIGQAFYVMDYIEGRIFTDRLLSQETVSDRTAIYDSMNDTLARLHLVDFRKSDLEDFGRAENYVSRQVARWGKQYQASKVESFPAMDNTIAWLEARKPAKDEAAISHGDYRLGNLMIHPEKPQVVAVLDWELATIGHPLADLAYNCLPWRLTAFTERGFADLDYIALGIPTEADYVAAYCRRTSRLEIPDWDYFLIFAMFRSAAILCGVYRRALDGNAADAGALQTRAIYEAIAQAAWHAVQTRF